MKFDKLMLRHEDAERLGSADKALILEFIRWSCHYKAAEQEPNLKYHRLGHWWMQDSFDAWQKRMPWLSLRTIKTYFNELYEVGAIDKITVGNARGGRDPNFYRVIEGWWVKCKKCQKTLSANSALVECENCTRLSANSALSFISTNNPPDNQTNNPASGDAPKIPLAPKMTDWESTDEFAKVFENLNKLPASRRQFHREKYRAWLTELKIKQATTTAKLAELADEWQKYHNASGGRKPTKISMSFETWVKNHFAWGRDKDEKDVKRGPDGKPRMGESGYEIDDEWLANLGKPPEPKADGI